MRREERREKREEKREKRTERERKKERGRAPGRKGRSSKQIQNGTQGNQMKMPSLLAERR